MMSSVRKANASKADRTMYGFLEKTAGHAMTRTVDTVTRTLSLRELSDMIKRDDFNTYPVVEDGEVIGIVTKFDVLKCFAFTPNQMVPRYSELMNRTVDDIMVPDFISVRRDTRLTRVLQLMVEHRIRSIPVIDGHKLAGIVTREDVLKALAAAADA
jgi:CBS domain-containing protein